MEGSTYEALRAKRRVGLSVERDRERREEIEEKFEGDRGEGASERARGRG